MMTRDIHVYGQPTWSNFIVCQQCSNRSKNEISSLLINLLTKCLPHNDHVTDLWQCLNWVQLDRSPLFGNLSHAFAQTMTIYYCIGTEQSDFEQCLNWLQLLPNFTFGQMFKQIGTRYSQIWHTCTDNYGCDFEPCLS